MCLCKISACDLGRMCAVTSLVEALGTELRLSYLCGTCFSC